MEVESSDVTVDFPLTVVVKQKSGVLSWQIPMNLNNSIDDTNFNIPQKTSRTLCPFKNSKFSEVDRSDKYATISLSTDSPEDINFKLKVSLIHDFIVK